MSRILVDQIRSNSASADAMTLDGSGNITVPGNITCSGTATGFPGTRKAHNLIINGAMQVAQRATSSTSESYATVDRWQFYYSGNDELGITQSQSTDAPDGFNCSYAVDITTVESAVDANEYFQCAQRIEAQNLQSVGANQLTLSFYVKAYQTGTYTVAIYQQDGNRLVTSTYTISSSATWEKKTITFPANTGTQPDNNNAFGYEVAWILAAGTGFTSADSTSWGSYSDAKYGYGQGVNVTSSTDNYWKITGVQLEVGTSATDFAYESYAETLRKCQRYYFKETATVYPATGYGSNPSTNCLGVLGQPCTMRATPTATFGSTSYWGSGPTGGGQSPSYSYVYGQTSSGNGPRIAGYELSAEL